MIKINELDTVEGLTSAQGTPILYLYFSSPLLKMNLFLTFQVDKIWGDNVVLCRLANKRRTMITTPPPQSNFRVHAILLVTSTSGRYMFEGTNGEPGNYMGGKPTIKTTTNPNLTPICPYCHRIQNTTKLPYVRNVLLP